MRPAHQTIESQYGNSMLASIVALVAVSPQKFPLTVESIMRGYSLVGHSPRNLKWSPDGKQLTFSWAKAEGSAEPVYRQYLVNLDGAGLKFGDDKAWPAKPKTATPDKELYVSGGDFYVRTPGGTPKKLMSAMGVDYGASLALKGEAVVFLKEGNLFRLNVADGVTTELLPASELPASSTELSPNQATLAKEQAELFKDIPESPAASGEPSKPKRRRREGNFTISPSGDYAVIDEVETPVGVRTAEVPNYISASGYTEMIPTYDKVGDRQPQNRIILVDIKSGKKTEFTTPRRGSIGRVVWSPDKKRAVAWSYSEDNKDGWLLGFDSETQKVTQLWDEHDSAWTQGPGWKVLGWLPDSSRVYFESERTGFAHLMTIDPSGLSPKTLTSGRFEVSEARVDADRKRFLIISSAGSPYKRHVDELPCDGGPIHKLADLSADDNATFEVAPNGKDIAVVKSATNRPPELFINNIQVTKSPTDEWFAGPWTDPPIVMIPARDGAKVPARLYKPKTWKPGGPAVLFVHGAGYLQNVFNGWSYYYREFMFNHLLMDHGYAVLDMDYRGSAGYGAAWRTAIYRHMGGKDLDDQVDGVHWLEKTLGIDKKRVGIYGGSYGGFITLMAMFTQPGVFQAGAALRPVSDWANYNHGYTSDILNLPQNDKEAYRRSSPIYFANGLKGSLLICHGMVDTNVHFQDTVRLVERLIELRKRNWEVAPYPIEDHGFTMPSSWIDEYSRILALFDRVIGPGYRKR